MVPWQLDSRARGNSCLLGSEECLADQSGRALRKSLASESAPGISFPASSTVSSQSPPGPPCSLFGTRSPLPGDEGEQSLVLWAKTPRAKARVCSTVEFSTRRSMFHAASKNSGSSSLLRLLLVDYVGSGTFPYSKAPRALDFSTSELCTRAVWALGHPGPLCHAKQNLTGHFSPSQTRQNPAGRLSVSNAKTFKRVLKISTSVETDFGQNRLWPNRLWPKLRF